MEKNSGTNPVVGFFALIVMFVVCLGIDYLIYPHNEYGGMVEGYVQELDQVLFFDPILTVKDQNGQEIGQWRCYAGGCEGIEVGDHITFFPTGPNNIIVGYRTVEEVKNDE